VQDPTGGGPGFFASIVLGIVEGLTEFLPVSSTGHLIVADKLLGRSDPTFEVAIQAGAITAIAFLYRRRLLAALRAFVRRPADGDGNGGDGSGGNGRREGGSPGGRRNLLVLLVVAAIPAAVVGLAFERSIEELLFSPTTVATALLAGGVLLLALERLLDRRARAGRPPRRAIEEMTVRQALLIGLCQTAALIPGTSRSGATIAGALLCGFTRPAAAEFSFLVGLPILYGACLVKAVKGWERVSGDLLPDLLIGGAASFVTAVVIVGPFVRFLQHHSFRPFAYYRILAGGAMFALIAAGVL